MAKEYTPGLAALGEALQQQRGEMMEEEWATKLIDRAEARLDAEQASARKRRNYFLVALGGSLAIAGANELLDLVPHIATHLEAGIVGATGLGGALEAQYELIRG